MRVTETAAGLAGFERRGPGTDAERRAALWLAERARARRARGSDRAVLVPPQLGAGPRVAPDPRDRGQPAGDPQPVGRRRPGADRAAVAARRRAVRSLARPPPVTRARQPERRRHRPDRHAGTTAEPGPPDHHRQLRRRSHGPRLPPFSSLDHRAHHEISPRLHARLAGMDRDRDPVAARDGGTADRRRRLLADDRRDSDRPGGRAADRARVPARPVGRQLQPRSQRQRLRHRRGARARRGASTPTRRRGSPSTSCSTEPARAGASGCAAISAPTAATWTLPTRSSSASPRPAAGGPSWWHSDGRLVPVRYAPVLRNLSARDRRRRAAPPRRGPPSPRGDARAYLARARRLPAIAIGCLDGRGIAPRSHQPADIARPARTRSARPRAAVRDCCSPTRSAATSRTRERAGRRASTPA